MSDVPEIHSTYPVAVRWEGGRRGLATSTDGLPHLPVASPPPFGGPAGVWSPEHLFVLSATTCWMTTFIAVAELSRLEFDAVEAAGHGVLERGPDKKFWISRIVLRPRVTVRRGEDAERALRLIEKAEQACLIRRSVATAIVLEPEVVAPPARRPEPWAPYPVTAGSAVRPADGGTGS
jgi:organic hydroperoxide reductase OsmC/OhrA